MAPRMSLALATAKASNETVIKSQSIKGVLSRKSLEPGKRARFLGPLSLGRSLWVGCRLAPFGNCLEETIGEFSEGRPYIAMRLRTGVFGADLEVSQGRSWPRKMGCW